MSKPYNLGEFLALEPPPVTNLIEPSVLSVGGNMFIYGRAESFKSWIAIDLAFALSTGEPWLGVWDTHQTTVFTFQTEQTQWMYRERILAFAKHRQGIRPDPNRLWYFNEVGIKLDQYVGLGILDAHIKETKPGLVIIDNMYKVLSGSDSDEPKVKAFLDGLDKLKDKYNCAFVVVHHPRKARGSGDDDDFGFDEMRGSGVINFWADTIIKTHPTKFTATGRPEVVSLTFQKMKNARDEVEGINVRLNRTTTTFSLA